MIIAKNIISRDALFSLATPAATETHVPIPHSFLVEEATAALTRAGYQIIEEKHATASVGQRYFGGFKIRGADINADDRTMVFGLRNAHDKSFMASACSGTQMLVCENLCFSSDVTLGRKHTTHIIRDIPYVLGNVIGQLQKNWADMSKRIEIYQNTEIGFTEACELTVNLAEAKSINAKDVFAITQEFKSPRHPEFNSPTLWNLYNAVTENMKGTDLNKMPVRNMIMHSLLDNRAGFLSQGQQVTREEVLALN